MKILKIIPMYLLILVIGLMIIPNISAETTYSTGFEDGDVNHDYKNQWISTKETLTGSMGWARVTDEISFNGTKCFGVSQALAGSNAVKFEWTFNEIDGIFLKKFETYIYYDLDEYYGQLSFTFVDTHGNNFIMIGTERESQSDLTITYFNGIQEKRLGTVNKQTWLKIGFEVLNNNSIKYFLGDYSVKDYPYYVVDTEFPYLSRIEFGIYTYIDRFYFDDLKIYTNHKPNANPGGPYLGYKNEQVTLDGSESTDLDGTIAQYEWDFGDGNTGTGQKPTHTYNNAGTYTVKLTVTDNDDGENLETTSIIITESVSNSNGNKSPGFEIVFLLLAIIFIAFIKTKRK